MMTMMMMMMTLASSEAPAAAGPKHLSRIIICTCKTAPLSDCLSVCPSVCHCLLLNHSQMQGQRPKTHVYILNLGRLSTTLYIRTVWLVSVDIRSCVSPIA